MQIRFATEVTGEEYVTRKLWQQASLEHCPLHPEGGCGFRRHTAYERKSLPGAFVARFRCPQARRTFSLLPDCLASRFPAELREMEDVVAKVEQAASQEAAARDLWPELELASALRKLRRWRRAVVVMLVVVRGLYPDLFVDEPSVTAFREHLGEPVLVALRKKVARHLHALPPPLGFGPRPKPRPPRPSELQHEAGPDPPS